MLFGKRPTYATGAQTAAPKPVTTGVYIPDNLPSSDGVFSSLANLAERGVKAVGSVAQSAYNRGSEFLQAAEDTAKNPSMALTGEGMLRGAGALGGFVGDTISAVLPQEATDALGYAAKSTVKGVKNAIDTVTGNENVSDAISDVASNTAQGVSDFAGAHPRIAKDVSAAVDATNLLGIPLGKAAATKVGESAVGKAVKGSVDNVAESIAPTFKNELRILGEKTGVDTARPDFTDVLDITKPSLSKKETASALQKGNAGKSVGVLRTPTIKPTARDVKVAGTVADIVDPSKLVTENIDLVKNAQANEAKALASSIKEANIPLDVQELATHLEGIQKPIMLQSDATLSNAYDAAKKEMVKITESLGNGEPLDLSHLLQARKDFDAFVSTQFPDLYTSERLSPMRKALRDMRNSTNDFIAKKVDESLSGPSAKEFRDSLEKQSLMYEALENMSEKAAKGEIGKNAAQRFIKAHPGLKTAGKVIMGAGALGAGASLLD